MPTTPVLGLPFPVASDTADVPRDIKALADALDVLPAVGVPVGVMFMWPLSTPPGDANPSGFAAWLLCNGQVVSAANYPKLAGLLGSTGGNVTLPDLRERFPIGFMSGGTIPMWPAPGSAGGEKTHPLTVAEIPTHDHDKGTLATANETTDHTHPLSPGEYVPANPSTFYLTNAGAPGGSVAVVAVNGLTAMVNALSTGGRSAAHSHVVNGRVGFTGNGASPAHNNMPPYLTVNFIMRAA